MRRASHLALLFLCVGLITSRHVGARQTGSDPILDAWGFEENRGYLSELPFEHIDTLTGNVLLTFTDLELPGNGGLDVRIVRSFNSKPPAGWNFGLDGYPFRIENVDAPIPGGAPNPSQYFPRLLMPDGARYDVYPETGGVYTVFRTKKFWRYHVSGRRLQLTNGTECVYNASGQLVSIQDVFGNRIELLYNQNQRVSTIRQLLGTGATREISFTWNLVGNVPATMSYLGRTWSYGFQIGDSGRITSATPPVGGTWYFAYQFDFPDLLQTVTTPHNGQIQYDFSTQQFWTGSTMTPSRVLTTRWAYPNHANSQSGTWSFSYSSTLGAGTTVSAPHGVSVEHVYSTPGGGSERALQTARTYGSGVLLETETRQYQTQPVTTSGGGTILLPTSRAIARDNRTYTTTLSYQGTDFADYGRPWRIEESGDRQRTTTFTFDYAFDSSRWIKNKVSAETVTVDAQPFTTTRDHNFSTGFMESETRYGITHTYTSDGRGNVATATDGHGHQTTYSHTWGVLEDTFTPLYAIDRSINQDGTVASEFRRAGVTTFEYDAIGRRRWVRPPIGHGIETQYFTNEVREQRGFPGSITRSFLDGFGRVVRTENSVGVKTTTRYDALGRKTFESLPFEGASEVGTTYRYDGLSRLREVEKSGGQLTTHVYGTGGDVTITENNGAQVRVTGQDYSSFGDPTEPMLVGVTDAEGGSWSYQYNGLGRLTRVTQPGGSIRTWTYQAGQDILQSESHPEGGTTTYIHDGAGRLSSKTTPRTTFTYGYDFNDRLTSVTVPGVNNPHSVTIGYDDSDNRTLLRNGYVNSTFQYDAANRLELRRDTIVGMPDVAQTFYTYDAWDNLTRLDYPSQEVARYDYDTEGRPTRVTAGGAILGEVLAYHPSGAISRLRLGNNIVEDYAFDPQRYWPTSISGGPAPFNYTYTPVGNVQNIDRPNAPNLNQQFTYDRLDRLTLVTGFGAASYQYDALGNRTWKDAIQYVYNASTKRLSNVVGSLPNPEVGTYQYDNAGFTTNDPSGTYAPTPFDMMESSAVGGNNTLYRYDGDNLRRHKSGQEETFFFYGQGNELLSEWFAQAGGAPRPRRDYVYLGSRLVASLTPFQSTATFTVATSLVNEVAPSVVVTVRLTTDDGLPLAQAAAVSYSTSAGTAAAGADFTTTSGTFNFAAGTANNSTRTITVPILNDTSLETVDETFLVVLSGPVNMRLANAVHTVTIRDDEPWVGGLLDLPAPGATIRGAFQLGGWVLDQHSISGTGIDAVDLYARPGPSFAAPGIFLGRAIRNDRPDVAAQFGQQFLNSGFGLLAQGLAPNDYDIVPYVHIVSTGAWTTLQPTRVTAISGQAMAVEAPAQQAVLNQRFEIRGYAINQDATSGTGVDLVQVTAQPLPSGNPIALGNATYGISRPDVASLYGDQRFTNSGFSLTSTTLPAGNYRLDVSARSTVSGAPNQVRSVTITVRTDPRVAIDAPANGVTTGQPFLIGGWAVDLAAANGTGISTIHIWATPLGGGNPVFLGVPAFGPRQDIANYYGSQFLNSGYTLPSVAGLAPGQWQINVHAMSALTGTFNGVASTTITLPTPDALVNIDLPTEWATVGQPFGITGWAIDRASPNTVGIVALHVWAHPWSGASPVMIGAPLVNGHRPDVAGAYGAHYAYSGWGVTASGLAPGTYTIVAHPVSAGNVIVPGAAVRYITVQ